MEGLGIDPKILIGDIVTFVVLVAILKKYAYKSFLAVLETRRKKIEEGVAKSEQAEQSLANIRSLSEKIKTAGEKKAKELILAAEFRAQEKAKAILAAADEERRKVVADAEIAMEKERVQAKERQQKEALDLAFAVSGKFLAEKITKDQDKKIIERLAVGLK
ncbi:MAG: F0F1 ATP synthase subunit B [Candidatus Paceibacterota bacterium]